MPYIRVWIHAVWSTKNREPYLDHSVRFRIFEHMADNARTKNIFLDCIGGYVDHVHVLLSLGGSETISKTVQLIKGEPSFWINKNKIVPQGFEWQDEYFAVSVSESVVGAVRKYIINQETHHSKVTFAQEYNEFISKYGFVITQ